MPQSSVSTSHQAPKPEPCPHPEQRPCWRTSSNGVAHPWLQCRDCGRALRPIRKDEVALREQLTPEQIFDVELQDRGDRAEREAWRQWHEAQRAEESSAWWDDYTAYLSTPEWKQKRLLRLRKDDHTCQAMMDDCLLTATEVHHLTYVHVGNEPLFDLISVCSSCHEALTAMDRARRGAL